MMATLAQHFVGGLLCAPFALWAGAPPSAAALARLGALCETGWELQDTLVRAGQLAYSL